MRTIYFNEFLSEVNRPHSVFSLGFYKANGIYVEKSNIMSRSSHFGERKKFNRNGLLRCIERSNSQVFDVTIDLVMNFNGMEIVRIESK